MTTEYADACNNPGNVLLQKGKIQEAIAAYQRALALNPNHAIARANLERAVLQKQ